MADTTGNYKPFDIPPPGSSLNAQLAALQLLDRGWQVIPLVGKAPRAPGWQDAPDRLAFLKEHLQPDGNLGVVCGHPTGGFGVDGPLFMVGLDIDFTDLEAAVAAHKMLTGMAYRVGAFPKFMIAAQVSGGDSYSMDYEWVKDDKSIKLQILGRSDQQGPKQFVNWGMHPDTRTAYRHEKNADGMTLFDLRPSELPIVHLASFYADLNIILGALGWRWVIKATNEPGEGEFAGDISPEMIQRAKNLFKRKLVDLAARAAGTGRGDDTHRLGLQIGMHIKRGLLSLDECVAELQAAMPDNPNAWTREFQRGVHASTGEMLKADAAREEAKSNIDWESAAAAQGVDWEAIKTRSMGNGAPPGGGAGGACTPPPGPRKSGYELALDMLHDKVEKKNVLMHGGDTSMAAIVAEAATAAMCRRVFRGAANDVVRVLPSAGAHGLAALVAPDGDFNLSALPTPNVRESIPTDAGCKLLISDAVQCWSAINSPVRDGNTSAATVSEDGDTITWQETNQRGAVVMLEAKTHQWALREGYNIGRAAWLDNRDVWIRCGPPKGDTMKEAICNFRLGSGTVGTPRLNSVSTAPSFGREGRLLLDDGVLDVGPGEVVFTALGPLRGRVHVNGDADAAKARLRAFLKAFPFVDEVSEGVALSLLFTLMARGAFPIPPGYAIDAPEYGAGKTYLALVMAAVAGMGYNVIPCGSDAGTDEELVKRFETALMTGSSGMLLLDDVPGGKMPNFSTLRTYLSATTPEIKIRRFGKNDDQVTVRIDRSTLVVTGNAIDVSKDMIRRLLRCYLSQGVANEETGWTTEKGRAIIEDGVFKDPNKWAQLLSDALTILKHNWDHRPCQLTPTQNYEGWSRVVREAVKFALGVDVDDSREEMAEFDDDRQQWQETMARVFSIKGEAVFTTVDIAELAKGTTRSSSFSVSAASAPKPIDELAEEFEFHRGGQAKFVTRLGNFLKTHKDRAFPVGTDAMRLRRMPHKTKNSNEKTRWHFVKVR